ncbi:glycosyltransferase family 4 protein [Pseudomonas baetica]|nr:glycosyltransferase [Pseudomonas baetica]
MNFILYSDINDSSISQNLGHPDSSYYFVLKAYRPLLETLGRVHVVDSVAGVDPAYRQLLAAGQESVFLSFTRPQKTPIDLECPTVCVVAWEYDSIPDEQWGNDPRQDWTRMLARHGRVITLSSHAAKAIRRSMGEDFPVLVLPAPLWERFTAIREQPVSAPVNAGATLTVKGCIFDSRLMNLHPDNLLPEPLTPEEQAEFVAQLEASRPPPLTLKRRFVIARHFLRLWVLNLGHEQTPPVPRVRLLQNWYWEGVRDLLSDTVHEWLGERLPNIAGPIPLPVTVQPPPRDLPDTSLQVETRVDGVVYVSVFRPSDGRKNWLQILSAFCAAFRDTPDATLVMKFTQSDLAAVYAHLMTPLAQLAPFSCRVVMIQGYLDDAEYARLYQAASFYVNASHCEGLCLPLMEFMACGKPVIAPDHTAMQDYIDESVAFVVGSSVEVCTWPHDPRMLFRAQRYRPDWGSLKQAYENSYRMAKTQPQDYQRMSLAAAERMHDYCAMPALQKRVADFFGPQSQASNIAPVTDNASC